MQKSVLTLLVAALPLAAQQIKFPPAFEKLAAKASEKINVNLDASLVEFAGRFLSGEKPDEAAAKKLLGSLKGIYIRGFEFSKEGEYSPKDLDSIREQLKSPGWNCFFSAEEQGGRETVDICLHREGELATGLVVLAVEPKEVSVINIVGSIRPEDLATLSGKFGIPEIKKKLTAPAKPKQ
jgi:hypothetical protein